MNLILTYIEFTQRPFSQQQTKVISTVENIRMF